MAMNPMQRRARNSFLIGFLVSLIIMALVVLALLFRIKSINDAKEALEQLQKKVYVATKDLESGDVLDFNTDFEIGTVQTTMDLTNVIDETDFQFLDKDGNIEIKYNEDGSERPREVMMKISVPAGTIVTKDMIVETDEQVTATQRIQEYNMIVLPSQLKNGDYVDIRLSLPNGQDYIVLAKKRVLGTTANTIWLNVDELEISLLNSAIVESYYYTGLKLYAVPYVEPGMQESSQVTYPASPDALTLINNNPNILNEIKVDYANKYLTVAENRVKSFEGVLSTMTEEDKQAMVESGNSDEIEAMKSARQDFVSNLEGTDDVGYNE